MFFDLRTTRICVFRPISARWFAEVLPVFAGFALCFCFFTMAVGAATPPAAVTAPFDTKPAPSTFTIPINVSDLTGDGVSSYQFVLEYDPTVIDPTGPNFGCSSAGTMTGAAGMSVTCNVVPDGFLRISVFGVTPLTGSGVLLNLNFATDATATNGDFSDLKFSSMFFFNSSGLFASTFTNGRITIGNATAADVVLTGRVTDASGRAISKARVLIVGGLEPKFAITSAFGYYRLEVQPNATYVLSVDSKRYKFDTKTISPGEDIVDLDFVARP